MGRLRLSVWFFWCDLSISLPIRYDHRLQLLRRDRPSLERHRKVPEDIGRQRGNVATARNISRAGHFIQRIWQCLESRGVDLEKNHSIKSILASNRHWDVLKRFNLSTMRHFSPNHKGWKVWKVNDLLKNSEQCSEIWNIYKQMTGPTGHQICLKLGSGELDMTLFQFGRLLGS